MVVWHVEVGYPGDLLLGAIENVLEITVTSDPNPHLDALKAIGPQRRPQ